MDYTIYSLLTDVMWASILIGAAMLIRRFVKFFQDMFVPVSLLAGFLGLILGNNGFQIIKFSDQFGTYSGMLIIVVFVTVGLRGFTISKKTLKNDVQRVGRFFAFRNIGFFAQYSLPILLGIFVLSKLAPGLNPAFGMLMPAGWQGGHGTAAALGATLENLGWSDATDLAMTSATIGILTGIFAGIILIKIATKKGYTRYIEDVNSLPEEQRVGLIQPANRPPMGEETVAPGALDPFAWHLALVLIPSGIGYLITDYLGTQHNISVPGFSVGFLVAVLFGFLLRKTKIDKYVDKKVVSRIGGTATDFLVFFGVASIRVPVVIDYALPFGILMLFAIAWTVFHAVFIGPRLMKEDWFEKGVYVFGYSSGVVAIGLSLLRICDPENKSTCLDDTAICTPIETIIEIIFLAVAPGVYVSGNWMGLMGITLACLAALIILPIFFGWWHPKKEVVNADYTGFQKKIEKTIDIAK